MGNARMDKKETDSELIFVSIIIPVYNAESTIELCLDSLKKINYPTSKYEIIVSDNGSSDNTLRIVEQYKVKVVFETSVQSSYAARNKGIKEAKGELVAFTDADCSVSENWLRGLVKYADDKSFGCFAGEIEAYKPITLVEKFSERIGLLSQKGAISGYQYLPYAQTANAAYRKDVLDKIGGFNPDFISGGDGDIAWRMQKELGLKIKFIPEATVFHKHRTSLSGLYRQFKRYEQGKFSFAKYYPDYNLPTIKHRFVGLVKALYEAFWQLILNFIPFVFRKKDLVDLSAPFVNIIIHLAPFVVQWERRHGKHD